MVEVDNGKKVCCKYNAIVVLIMCNLSYQVFTKSDRQIILSYSPYVSINECRSHFLIRTPSHNKLKFPSSLIQFNIRISCAKGSQSRSRNCGEWKQGSFGPFYYSIHLNECYNKSFSIAGACDSWHKNVDTMALAFWPSVSQNGRKI